MKVKIVFSLFFFFSSAVWAVAPWLPFESNGRPYAKLTQTRHLPGVMAQDGSMIPHTITCTVEDRGDVVVVTQEEVNKLLPGIPGLTPNSLVSGFIKYTYSRANGEMVETSFSGQKPAAYRLTISGSGLVAKTFLRLENDLTWRNFLSGEIMAERNSFCHAQLKNFEPRGEWALYRSFYKKFQWSFY
jgi:hypothetical protein